MNQQSKKSGMFLSAIAVCLMGLAGTLHRIESPSLITAIVAVAAPIVMFAGLVQMTRSHRSKSTRGKQ